MTDRLKRINELAAKAKSEGLTPEEEAERKVLREEYLAAFRRNMTAQLDNLYILDEDGSERKLKKKE